MEGFRILLERLTQMHWVKLRDSGDPKDKIHNCQIFWYSRRNPKTQYIHGSVKYVKSICPYKPHLSYNSWESVGRTSFSNEDLTKHVQTIPQLVNSDPKEEASDPSQESYQAIPQ